MRAGIHQGSYVKAFFGILTVKPDIFLLEFGSGKLLVETDATIALKLFDAFDDVSAIFSPYILKFPPSFVVEPKKH